MRCSTEVEQGGASTGRLTAPIRIVAIEQQGISANAFERTSGLKTLVAVTPLRRLLTESGLGFYPLHRFCG